MFEHLVEKRNRLSYVLIRRRKRAQLRRRSGRFHSGDTRSRARRWRCGWGRRRWRGGRNEAANITSATTARRSTATLNRAIRFDRRVWGYFLLLIRTNQVLICYSAREPLEFVQFREEFLTRRLSTTFIRDITVQVFKKNI